MRMNIYSIFDGRITVTPKIVESLTHEQRYALLLLEKLFIAEIQIKQARDAWRNSFMSMSGIAELRRRRENALLHPARRLDLESGWHYFCEARNALGRTYRRLRAMFGMSIRSISRMGRENST